jgi:tetratricopeptide (TPR) repeat protein
MLNDSMILDALSEILSPGELSQLIERLLHVPEAWEQLHVPAFLENLQEQPGMLADAPASLAGMTLNLRTLSAGVTDLGDDLEEKLAEINEQATAGSLQNCDLETIALLAINILRTSTAEEGVEEIAKYALDDPTMWQSALACALPFIQEPERLIAAILAEGGERGISLALHILRANLSPEESASLLYRAAPEWAVQILVYGQRADEIQFCQAFATQMESLPEDTLDHHMVRAARNLALGDATSAHTDLTQAWEAASQSAGIVADRIAEIAQLEEDPVLALEARQQALRSYPSPTRRALYARALLAFDRSDEAFNALQLDSECVLEWIAAGLALLQKGEKDQAAEHLSHAAQILDTNRMIDDETLHELTKGLCDVGDLEGALTVSRLRVGLRPARTQPKTELASILLIAGDPRSAADMARLALAQEPDNQAARRTLAESLQTSGSADVALAHWQILVESDPSVTGQLAECALDASHHRLALETAQELLSANPDSGHAHLITGRALAAQGEYEAARDHLEEAIHLVPLQQAAWLALADCQSMTGDELASGNTLQTAVQNIPSCGELQIALAQWLRNQGRDSEALEAAQIAAELDKPRADWLLVYADILQALGHSDRALLVLREAYKLQPENWDVRQALAVAYESRDENAAAARLVQSLPQDASKHLYQLAGRIVLKAATQGDLPSIETGMAYLHRAKTAEETNPEIDRWLARGFELSGKPEEALQTYQICLGNLSNDEHDLRREALLGIARTAVETDQVPLAITTLEEARQQYPASAHVLTQLSSTYLAANLSDQALQMAHRAVDLDPTGEPALRSLSKAAVANGDYAQAIQAMEQLLQVQPKHAGIWLELAELALNADEHDKAKSAVAKSLWLGRRDTTSLQKTASALVALGEPASAQRALQHATQRNPQDVNVLHQLAKISEAMGDFEGAQQAWCRGVELEPDNPTVHDHAARVMWKLNRPTSAIDFWKKAAALKPEDVQVLATLADALLTVGEISEGLSSYDAARKITPEDPDLLSDYGRAALDFATPEEAHEILRKAVRLAPDRTTTLVDWGECLMKLKRHDDASRVLKQATSRNDASQRAFALKAECALLTEDLPSAKAALKQASDISPRTSNDSAYLARVAARLGDWQEAAQALEAWDVEEDDADALSELARHRLQMLDARWLYADASKAYRHAPPAELTDESAAQAVQSILLRYKMHDVPQDASTVLHAWHDLHDQQYPMDPVALLESIGSHELSGDLAQALIIAYLRNHDLDHAEAVIEIRKSAPMQNAWDPILLALTHAARGRYSQALEAYATASEDPVVRPLARYLRAECWLQEGAVEEATSELNEALAIWPDEPAWHFALANRYIEAGHTDSAMPHLQQASELAPVEMTYQIAYGKALYQSGAFSEAETVYARVLETKPSQGEIWKQAGQIAIAIGEFQKAEKRFERACTLSPADAHCLIGAARTSMHNGQTQEALERAQAAARIAPDDLEVLLGMGEIFTNQGKYEKALIAYDKALKQANNKVSVHVARSKLLIQIGRAQQATKDLSEALEMNSDDQRAWAALAEAYENVENLDAALTAAARAVRLAPRDPMNRLLLGRLCRKNGHLDRALDELTKAQEIAPSNAPVAFELGRTFEERRELEGALEAYHRAITLDNDHGEAHFHTGVILKQLKAYQKAAKMFERAVDLNPRDSKALHQLAAVRALELVHGGIQRPAVTA